MASDELSQHLEQSLGPPPPCIFCGAEETEWIALYGTLLNTHQAYCRACRSVFEVLKGAQDPGD